MRCSHASSLKSLLVQHLFQPLHISFIEDRPLLTWLERFGCLEVLLTNPLQGKFGPLGNFCIPSSAAAWPRNFHLISHWSCKKSSLNPSTTCFCDFIPWNCVFFDARLFARRTVYTYFLWFDALVSGCRLVSGLSLNRLSLRLLRLFHSFIYNSPIVVETFSSLKTSSFSVVSFQFTNFLRTLLYRKQFFFLPGSRAGHPLSRTLPMISCWDNLLEKLHSQGQHGFARVEGSQISNSFGQSWTRFWSAHSN